MIFKYYRNFEKDGLADTAKWEESWTADQDLTLKRIYLARKDGASFTKSKFYLKVAEAVYTRPVVPAELVGSDLLVSPELNIPVKNCQPVSWTLENLEGVSIDVWLTFEVWTP